MVWRLQESENTRLAVCPQSRRSTSHSGHTQHALRLHALNNIIKTIIAASPPRTFTSSSLVSASLRGVTGGLTRNFSSLSHHLSLLHSLSLSVTACFYDIGVSFVTARRRRRRMARRTVQGQGRPAIGAPRFSTREDLGNTEIGTDRRSRVDRRRGVEHEKQYPRVFTGSRRTPGRRSTNRQLIAGGVAAADGPAVRSGDLHGKCVSERRQSLDRTT